MSPRAWCRLRPRSDGEVVPQMCAGEVRRSDQNACWEALQSVLRPADAGPVGGACSTGDQLEIISASG